MRIGKNISYKKYTPANLEITLASLQGFPNGLGNSIWAYSYHSTYYNKLKSPLFVMPPIIL